MHFLKQHDEFIPSLPAHRVRCAYLHLEAFCDGLKQFVADQMSQGIVDVLEAIQIQENHRDEGFVTLRQGDGLTEPVIEEQSIGQTGERVMLGGMLYLFRQGLCRAHVAENDDRSGSLSYAIVNGGGGVLNEGFMSIPTDEEAVWRQMPNPVLFDSHVRRIGDVFASHRVHDPEDFIHGMVIGFHL